MTVAVGAEQNRHSVQWQKGRHREKGWGVRHPPGAVGGAAIGNEQGSN